MKRILIIDDEQYITDIINAFSVKLGYKTDSYQTWDKVLEKIVSTDYWAVLCDLKMPGLNGLEIFEKIREIKSELARRFVLLTGSIPDTYTEGALQKQNIHYFRKPFTFSDFSNLITVLEKQA